VQILNDAIGNPALKPEIADTTEIGLVYRPHWAPGLDVSFDYYDITVNQAISSLTNQQIVDLCYNGNTAYCKDVSLGGVQGTASAPYVIVQPFNLASLTTHGFDIEASYRFNLNQYGVPGSFTLRGLATHIISYISNPGIAGQIVQQYAGDNGTGGSAGDIGTPYWKAYIPESWTVGPATLTLTERVISDGLINPNYITCTASCPAPTVQNPTTNFNHIPGAVYLDIGGSYDLNKQSQVYFKVDNLTNYRIPPFASPTIYDVIGTMFHVGFRYTH
jgi:outer membrane receptor protein involved in Fe transport